MAVTSLTFIYLLVQFAGFTFGNILECSQNSDCTAKDAECKNNICQCPFGQVFNLEYTTCLPIAIGVNADCKDDNQCAWLLGKYKCNKNKCDCEEGWRYYRGRCIKMTGLNALCTKNEECFNGYDMLAMVCNGVCVCNKGYYLRGDYDCRPETTVIGSKDYCSLDSDCKIENSICVSSHCILMDKVTSRVLRQDLETQASVEERIYENRVQDSNYNKDCTMDNDCSTLGNGVCYQLTKKCICKRGYFLLGNTCVPELGQDSGCKVDEDCKISPGRCIDGKCFCRKTYFSGKTNQACQKPMTKDNLFCNSAERCNVLGTEVFCDSENQCKCKVTAELDKDFICRPVDGGIEVCEENEPCTSVINSFCIDQKCQCKPNYRLEKNACVPNIEAACNENILCTIENSVCGSDGNCICSDKFVASEDKTKCLEMATGLEDKCEIDTQCSEIVKNSHCIQNICKCINNHVSVNGSCYQQKLMGDLCTDVTQCHIMLKSRVQCRNSICQCSADMQPIENGLDCAPTGSTSSIILHGGTIILLITCHLILKLQVNIK